MKEWLLVLLALAPPISGGWIKKKGTARPNPNAERRNEPSPQEPTFVKRINNTHAYVTEMDEEMRDILHRIRKKATGMESLSQEAALMQVERIRKQISGTTIEPIIRAETYAGANAQQDASELDKSLYKATHKLDTNEMADKVASVFNSKAWVVETPDMLEVSEPSIQNIYF
mmetsp:Transcript_23663/g.41917  ORF Transcript_23663/g.41917 Transcript_23663/m.41917 type:complete len:172 (-) Transcript_23663:98-613(-)